MSGSLPMPLDEMDEYLLQMLIYEDTTIPCPRCWNREYATLRTCTWCLDSRRVHKDSLTTGYPPLLPDRLPIGVQHLDLTGQNQQRAWGYDGPGWYFWDETQSNCIGPFPDVLEATDALHRYAQHLSQEH